MMRLGCPYRQGTVFFFWTLPLSNPLLSLVPSGLTGDRLLPTPDRILLIARSRSASAICPLCGSTSTRAHSFYLRRLNSVQFGTCSFLAWLRAFRRHLGSFPEARFLQY